MAEQIIIDIQLKGFDKAEGNLKKLTAAQIAETDAIKITTQQIKFYEKTLAELESAKLKNGQLTESQTAKEAKYQEKLNAAKTSLTSQKDELQKINAERRAAVKEISTLTAANESQLGSNERMKAQLKLLTSQYNGLSASERENSNVGKKMGADILSLTEKLKANEKAVGDNKRNVGNYSGALSQLGGTLRNVAGAFGVFMGAAAIGKLIKDSTKIITNFETSFVNLSNKMGLTREQIVLLKEQAMELGATTAFSASEVLNLQEAYAGLGFSQQQIIDLTPGTIDGALALRATAQQTAELVGAMVGSFANLEATDTAMILDQMTAATQRSALTFEKLNSALPSVAAAASASGVSFDQVLALLGKLSDAGIDASKSGTALKNIFIVAAKEGKDYSQILDEIANSSNVLTGAVDKTGKISAVSATVLATAMKETKKLNDEILDSVGASARVAAESLNTTEGKMKLLVSAWEGFVLSVDNGDGVIQSMIKGVLDFLTGGLTILTENTRGVKNALILLTGAIAIYNAGLILSTALTIKNAIATKLKAAGDVLLSGVMGVASLAMLAYNTVVGASSIGMGLATAAAIVFKATLDVLSGGLTLVITAIVAAVTTMLILVNRTKELTAVQKAAIDVKRESEKAYAAEKIQVDKLVKTLENETGSREDTLKAIEELNKIMPEGIATITEEDVATGKLTDKINALNEAKVLQYKLTAIGNKQIAASEEIIDAESSSINDNISFMERLAATIGGLTTEMTKEQLIESIGAANRSVIVKSLKEKQAALEDLLTATNAEFDALTATNEASGEAIKLSPEEIAANEALAKKKEDAAKKAAKDAEKREQDEKDRLESIAELLRSEKEELEFKKDKLLKELELSDESKTLTATEASAKKLIIDQYNQDIKDIEQKAIDDRKKETAKKQQLVLDDINKRIDKETDAAELIALQNEKDYLTKFNALNGNLAAQQKLTRQYNAQKLQDAKALAEQEFQVLQQQLVGATASIDGGIPDVILSEDMLADLKKRLAEVGVYLATLDGQIAAVGSDETIDEGSTLADKLGLDEEQTEAIKASYSAAVSGINTILDVASQNLKTNTDQRIAAIDSQIESGVISEEDAEKKKVKIRKDAFDKQKKLDLARASLSYFTGLIQAIAGAMALPPPANFIVGAISTASLTAAYAANVSQINAQKFADGGLIQGASHSKGGVPFSVAGRGGFEAEGGEFIHKTKAVDHYGLPFMNALNNMQLPKVFAEGGYVAPMTSSSISQQVSAGVSELVSESQNRSIQVLNVESDFSNLQNKVNNVESARTY
jgi:hypothetical protein